MCLNSFLKASKGNNRISKSRAFHNVGAAYTNDLSKNELAHVLGEGGVSWRVFSYIDYIFFANYLYSPK